MYVFIHIILWEILDKAGWIKSDVIITKTTLYNVQMYDLDMPYFIIRLLGILEKIWAIYEYQHGTLTEYFDMMLNNKQNYFILYDI